MGSLEVAVGRAAGDAAAGVAPAGPSPFLGLRQLLRQLRQGRKYVCLRRLRVTPRGGVSSQPLPSDQGDSALQHATAPLGAAGAASASEDSGVRRLAFASSENWGPSRPPGPRPTRFPVSACDTALTAEEREPGWKARGRAEGSAGHRPRAPCTPASLAVRHRRGHRPQAALQALPGGLRILGE